MVGEVPLPAIVHRGRRRRAIRLGALALAVALIAGSLGGAAALLLRTTRQLGGAVAPGGGVRIKRIAIPGSGGAALQYGEGAAWLFGPDAIFRVDPKTSSVSKTQLGGQPLWLATGEGGVWVPICPNSESTEPACNADLIRLDPKTLRVEATLQLPLPVAMTAYSTITVGDGLVWVSSVTQDKVMVVDPASNRVIRVLKVPCCMVGAGFGSLWLETPDGLMRVRESDGAEQMRFDLFGTFLLSITPTAVWTETSSGPGGVVRIDPTTNTIAATWRTPSFFEMDAHGSDVWLAQSTAPVGGLVIQVIRLDKDGLRQIGGRILIRPNPAPPNYGQPGLGLPSAFITVGGGSAWVWNFTDADLVKITPSEGA